MSKPSGRGTWYISEILATIDSLKFFEGGSGGVAFDDRQYRRFFDPFDARYIFYEIEISYRRQHSSRAFDIEHVYYLNGVRDSAWVTSHSTFQNATGSVHTGGVGRAQAGTWKRGDWTLELYSEGVLIGTGEFGVD